MDGFVIHGLLGADGMGEVYRAFDLQLQREVALKVPRAALLAQDLFLAEARALAQLKHPNVVAIHSCGTAGPHLYFTMDLVDGPNAAVLIKRLRDKQAQRFAGPHLLRAIGLDLTRVSGTLVRIACRPRSYYRLVALWLAEVTEGLGAAHKQGILHRDIKPSNLLLAPDGRMMLADFGLAQRTDAPVAHDAVGVTGTYPYVAPERAAGDWARVDHRADIWALGATLYEFLTYQRAYPRQGREVLQDITTADPQLPRKIVPEIPRQLERICLKALRRAPDQRYQTAQAMAQDLRAYAERRHFVSVRVCTSLALAAVLLLALLSLARWSEYTVGLWQCDATSATSSVSSSSQQDSIAILPVARVLATLPSEPVVLLACNEDLNAEDDTPPHAGSPVEACLRKALTECDEPLKLAEPLSAPATWDAALAIRAARELGASIVLLAELSTRDLGLIPDLKYVGYPVRRWEVTLRVRLVRVLDERCETMPELSMVANRPDSERYNGSGVRDLVAQAAEDLRARIVALHYQRN